MLIVEDDKYKSEIYKDLFEKRMKGTFKVSVANTFIEAESTLRRNKHRPFDYILLDHDLDNGRKGIELVGPAKYYGHRNISVLTANEDDLLLAKSYFTLGAKDYFVKGQFFTKFDSIYNRIYFQIDQSSLVDRLREKFVTNDKKFLLEAARSAFKSTEHVIFLEGQSGTGKNALAKGIHHISGREGPFIELDSTVFTGSDGNIVNSKLFGHEKGTWTGADREKVGAFERANGGTIFINEIDKMDIITQGKLLTFFDDRTIKKWSADGKTQPKKIDVRVIIASAKNLESQVRRGAFEDNLYKRISAGRINLKPLRERPEDVKTLIEYFLSSKNREKVIAIEDDARHSLEAYLWDGNVRQLDHEITELFSKDSSIITMEHLPEYIINNRPSVDYSKSKNNNLDSSILIEGMSEMGLRNFTEKLEVDAFREVYLRVGRIKAKAYKQLKISRTQAEKIIERGHSYYGVNYLK